MKRLLWIGSSHEDLKDFPDLIRGAMGHALYLAQIGKKHEHAKVLQGNKMKITKPRKKRIGTIEYTESSGNVFADLGLPHPEEALAKAEIASKIQDIIKEKKLSQAQAAKILEISQPKISLLLRGFLTNFSLERLLRFLNDLGQDVYISVVPSSHKDQGSTRIGNSTSSARVAALGR